MKIISFSDLHLEFGKGFSLPDQDSADLLILAGDVMLFKDYIAERLKNDSNIFPFKYLFNGASFRSSDRFGL